MNFGRSGRVAGPFKLGAVPVSVSFVFRSTGGLVTEELVVIFTAIPSVSLLINMIF